MLEEWLRKASEFTATTFPALRQTFGSADYVDGFTISMLAATVIVSLPLFIMTSNGCIFVR
jgi:hypothetical protein